MIVSNKGIADDARNIQKVASLREFYRKTIQQVMTIMINNTIQSR